MAARILLSMVCVALLLFLGVAEGFHVSALVQPLPVLAVLVGSSGLLIAKYGPQGLILFFREEPNVRGPSNGSDPAGTALLIASCSVMVLCALLAAQRATDRAAVTHHLVSAMAANAVGIVGLWMVPTDESGIRQRHVSTLVAIGTAVVLATALFCICLAR